MNIFYYPVILIDNIDKIFLAVDNDFLFYCIVVLFVLAAISLPILISLTKKEKLRDNILFYVVLSFICLVVSLSLVWFVSIPFVLFLVQFIAFVYNNYDNTKNKIKKSGVVSILFVFVGFIILLNLICPVVEV